MASHFPCMRCLLTNRRRCLVRLASKPGEMKCSFGTGSFLLMNIGKEMRLSNNGLLTTMAWHWDEETAYALDGGIFVTGAAVQWLTESLHFLPDPAASAEVALQSKDDDVVVVPALQGLAAPHWLSDVRGAIFGLSRGSLPADIVRPRWMGLPSASMKWSTAMSQDAGQAPPHLKVDGGPRAILISCNTSRIC